MQTHCTQFIIMLRLFSLILAVVIFVIFLLLLFSFYLCDSVAVHCSTIKIDKISSLNEHRAMRMSHINDKIPISFELSKQKTLSIDLFFYSFY